MDDSIIATYRGTVEIDGHEVRRFRNWRDKSPAELAALAEIGQSTIEKWEAAGVAKATAANVKSVAKALGVEPEELLTATFRQSLQRMRNKSRPKVRQPAASDSAAPSAHASSSRPCGLPMLLSDFVGREEEVRAMVGRLAEEGSRIGLSALKGMGGIGKTTLAVRVAHEVKDRFSDGVLFVDLLGVSGTPRSANEVMHLFIQALRPEASNLPTTDAGLLSAYRSTLADCRVLIVLDNASGDAQVKDLVAGEKNGFIITSRNALSLDGVQPVRLDDLSAEESFALIRGIVREAGSDDELRTVVELCGRLPLALRVAGSFIHTKEGWTVQQYIDALRKERLRWLRVGDDSSRNVDFVLKLSSAQLRRDNEDLAVRWHCMWDWPADFSAEAAAVAWEDEPDSYDKTISDLTELVDRSLVLVDRRTGRYRLHDLMKPIAEELFG